MSTFGLVHGYTPALCGLPQTPVSEDIKQSHHVQTDIRSIQRLLKYKMEFILPTHLLPRDREVFYFFKGPKPGNSAMFVNSILISSKYHRLKNTRVNQIHFLTTTSGKCRTLNFYNNWTHPDYISSLIIYL